MPPTRRKMLEKQRNVIKDFKEKMQNMRDFVQGLDSFTDGQVKVKEVDWDQLQSVTIGIRPNAGPYKGGEYPFKLTPGSNDVELLADVPHPNIDKGNICIDQDDVRYTLDRTVIGILNTFHEPQYYDISSLAFNATCGGEPMDRIYRTTRVALTGRPVGSLRCPRYIEDDDEILKFLEEMKMEKQTIVDTDGASVSGQEENVINGNAEEMEEPTGSSDLHDRRVQTG